MAVLQVLQGLDPGKIFPLEGASVILGRHPACDIVLESASVSRQHARILNIDGDFYVEDLHSRNGTLLNGRTVMQRQLLAENDELGICDLSFVFHRERRPSRASALPSTRREPVADAVMVDDDRPTNNSTIMSKLIVSSGSTGLRLEVNTEAKLKALIEIGQSLGRALGLAEVLPKLLDSLFTIFVQADRGFIVLRDPQTGRLVPKAIKHRRHDDTQTLRISRTIVGNVMTTKEAILSADAATDSRFDMSESIVDFHIRSMICAPLVASDGEALGVIQLDALDQRNRFRQDDLEMLVSVACQAAFAVENAQLHEIGDARSGDEARAGGRPRSAAGIPAVGRAADSRVRFLRVLRAGQPVGRRLLRLHRFARRPAGGRGGRRFRQGHFGLAADGQALGRDPLLPGQRARARAGHRAGSTASSATASGTTASSRWCWRCSIRGGTRSRSSTPAICRRCGVTGRSPSSRWPRPRPVCRWASIATSTTPIARCRFRPATR